MMNTSAIIIAILLLAATPLEAQPCPPCDAISCNDVDPCTCFMLTTCCKLNESCIATLDAINAFNRECNQTNFNHGCSCALNLQLEISS